MLGISTPHGDGVAELTFFGLFALQHRGQEAAGICSYTPATGFNTVRRIGQVRDNFTKQSVMDLLPGSSRGLYFGTRPPGPPPDPREIWRQPGQRC